MKKMKIIGLMIALLAGLTVSCTKSSSSVSGNNNTNPTPSTYVTATVNGASWAATTALGLKTNVMSVNGINTNGTEIHLTLPLTVTANTYTLDQVNYKAQYDNGSATYNSTSGSISVSAVSATGISGTFSFNAANIADASMVVGVTNGSFNVSF